MCAVIPLQLHLCQGRTFPLMRLVSLLGQAHWMFNPPPPPQDFVLATPPNLHPRKSAFLAYLSRSISDSTFP